MLGGLLEVALHPRFAQNQLLYLTYTKTRDDGLTTTALARGRFDGKALSDVKEIFVANNWSKSTTNYGGRIAFDRNGFLFLTVGERQEQERAQNTRDHGGKVLRLRDDGSVPPDNPFVGKAGLRAGDLLARASQPAGAGGASRDRRDLGERARAARRRRDQRRPARAATTAGRWSPSATTTTARRSARLTSRPDLEAPFMYWIPSIAISGMTFYTGDRFPAWKGNAFVGSMFQGRTRGTGHIQRITFNEGRPIQREPILTELRQRIRDVRQGPDGLLYVLTDEDNGAVLKIEPAAAEVTEGTEETVSQEERSKRRRTEIFEPRRARRSRRVVAVRLAAEGGLPRCESTQIQTAPHANQRLVFACSHITAVGVLRTPTNRTAVLRSSPFSPFLL